MDGPILMAYGSMGQMRAYAEKVFEKDARLSRMSDGRTAPAVPLAAALTTWQWGLVRRAPSTEQIGDLLLDRRWRARLGLKPEDGGSPDTAARILDDLSIEEWNAMMLEDFFIARRAGIVGDDGQYGKRCAALDLNELFKSEKIHCPQCQVREKTIRDAKGEKRTVPEYYHQAVALSWISGDIPLVIGWEVLRPGEGELTAALRLLERLLPRLRKSLDLVIGDALYCCRPFFETVCGAGLQAMAISSGQTEMDEEIDLLIKTTTPRLTPTDVAIWEMESEAWQQQLKCKLRVIHGERRYEAPSWKHERQHLRVMTSAPTDILPAGQGWKVGRSRWTIENGTFNRLSHDYGLTHNYRHSVAAIVGLLAMRSFACLLSLAYWANATARSKDAPQRFLKWFQLVVIEDWVRYMDQALFTPDRPSG
jgi:hypothetical protein